MEGLPAGLLYQRMVRNGSHGKEVIEIFYNGVEPPRCNKSVCKPMDDAELTEYLRKSVMEGRSSPNKVPIIREYAITVRTTIRTPEPTYEVRHEPPTFPEDLPTSQEEPTTTENLFISQEEEDEEEEEEEDDNIY